MTIMERCGGGDEVVEVTACPVPKTWDLLKWGLMETRYHFYNGVKSEENALHLLHIQFTWQPSIATQVKHSSRAYLFGVFSSAKKGKKYS